ncbi:hypothetical protein N8600_10855 [Gammaproteobacteria bacterium]|nr:hypothetical protein [bacterium]MDC1529522.1 hypothetical protein [Gammaproteobacteria bacterium]
MWITSNDGSKGTDNPLTQGHLRLVLKLLSPGTMCDVTRIFEKSALWPDYNAVVKTANQIENIAVIQQ